MLLRTNEDGSTEGVDPRTLPIASLIGYEPSLMKAVRKKCIDCSGGEEVEARKCTAVSCDLWPFRMGKNVFRSAMAKDNPNVGIALRKKTND